MFNSDTLNTFPSLKNTAQISVPKLPLHTTLEFLTSELRQGEKGTEGRKQKGFYFKMT